MPGYSYITITFSRGFPAGLNCIGFYADISDPDMSDNTREECFTWTGYVNIDVGPVNSPSSLEALADTDITVRVTNDGTADSSDSEGFDVLVEIDAAVVGGFTLDTGIGAGATTSVKVCVEVVEVSAWTPSSRTISSCRWTIPTRRR